MQLYLQRKKVQLQKMETNKYNKVNNRSNFTKQFTRKVKNSMKINLVSYDIFLSK